MENNLPPKLKYNIATRLDRMDRRRVLSIRRRILSKPGRSATSWHDWLKLTTDDPRDIPAGVLFDIACEIGVPMEHLFNVKCEPNG